MPRNMILWNVVFTVLAATASLSADITQTDFLKMGRIHSAQKLLDEGKHEEARSAFEALAADAATELEESKFQARAAIALGMKESGYEAGLEKAKAIQHRPYAVYAQLEIMRAREKYEAVVAQFKDEPIGEWSDYPVPPVTAGRWDTSPQDVKMYAWRARGIAFYETGQAEAADHDLQEAIGLCKTDRKGDQWLKLGLFGMSIDNATQQLKDEDKAFELKMRTVRGINRFKGKSQYMGIVTSVANRLREKGEFDRALNVLDHARLKDGVGTWFGVGKLAYGRVYVAKADAQEAEAQKLKQAGQAEQAAGLMKQASKSREMAVSFFNALVESPKGNEGHKKAAEEALAELR